MTNLLTAQGIVVKIGDALLVDGVSLEQEPGFVTAIIGPNGAGKSTLLSVLAGDRQPSSGSVTFGDDDAAFLSPLEKATYRSVLPQAREFNIPFTAWEVVMMGRHPFRREPSNSGAADREAVLQSMERCDVIEFKDRVFASLSGGEQARVSMARVLAQKTPLVLLDEPSGGLDVRHETRMLDELRRLADEGRGVIAVFHDLNSAASVANNMVVMKEGAVAAMGSPGDVMTADVLSAVYDQALRVVEHPFRNVPLILPEH